MSYTDWVIAIAVFDVIGCLVALAIVHGGTRKHWPTPQLLARRCVCSHRDLMGPL